MYLSRRWVAAGFVALLSDLAVAFDVVVRCRRATFPGARATPRRPRGRACSAAVHRNSLGTQASDFLPLLRAELADPRRYTFRQGLWSNSNIPSDERLLAACTNAVERIAWPSSTESTGAS